jgi:16S rRNA (uracil1498-N3)-methyltransferase
MTRRRWIAEHWDEATATIVGAQAEHMARVLRAQPGMEADVVAGGHVFHAEVAAVCPHEIRFNLVAEVRADPALPVTLVLAVYKFDRMEWVLEKATELGVAAVAPVIARRTEKHLAEAAESRVERWRRIVHEAAQQSRRSDVPLIYDPAPLAVRVRAASLGPRILRAETAAIAALAVVASCLE